MIQPIIITTYLALLVAVLATPLTPTTRSYKHSVSSSNSSQVQAAASSNSSQVQAATSNTTATTRAVYFMTNAANNSIVAMKVKANGKLSHGSITATGGAGMSGVDSTGAPAAPDSLFSQGAVKVVGNNLLVVNPGSNTVSMFAINSRHPTKLTMVGQPMNTLGEFPTSIAVSASLGMACVANSGAKAGVACFKMSSAGLAPLDTTLRAFNINQSTPPKGPTNTVSQTFFNADSTALITTVKGDPAVNNTGFLSVFPVSNGVVSQKDTQSSPAGTAVLFGASLIPGSNNLFVTDASFGSATLSLSTANVATVSAQTKIADQAATCWATFSDVTKSAFVTDVAVNHLVEVDTSTGQLIKTTNLTNKNPGMIDLVSAGNFIYALSPGNATTPAAVAVIDVSGGQGTAKEIQNFKPKGVPASAQGMAVL
ncbi:hypothetical protein BP5796_12610 [Coleophoma crateriformis]|uniref:3-carboxymuconate cyclase n=1 Tax=Coleophoma crateriformis TaxID=565419 RepID=A0A3D8Q7N6_9HELO|nr:hypothetical protein BP5796_12610 [Coleophoma crateriformis]